MLIQGRVELLLIASCCGNHDKLQPDGLLGLNADCSVSRLSKVENTIHQINRYPVNKWINVNKEVVVENGE